MDILVQRENKTVYRDNDKTIKLFVENYSKANILNEALNQARVEETDLNIPKLLEVSKIDNRWAITLEHIEGKSLQELMNEHPENMDEYLDWFVDIQLYVHSKKEPMLNRLKDKMKERIAETNLDESIKFELNARLATMPTHTKICHGDFNPSNIIINNDGVAYILDWAHVTQGNGSADVARTYLLFNLEGKKDIAEKYLKKYAEKSNIDKHYIQRWIPIVAAAHLVKANENEKNFLMNWINVAEY